MEEKLYYKDEKVRISDSMLTVNHVSVPLDRIEKIMVGFKTIRLAVSFAVFMLSIVFVWAGCYFYDHYCLFGILLVIGSLAYLISVCRTYIELKISTEGSRPLLLLDCHMNNREYIYTIVDALEQAAE